MCRVTTGTKGNTSCVCSVYTDIVNITYVLIDSFSRLLHILSTHANRQGVDISVTVCLFYLLLYVCVFVRIRISLPRIKLAASNCFYLAVHWSPRQEITNFCELCSPRSPKLDPSALSLRATLTRM